MSSIFIQNITTETKLTRHWKIRDQIDTIEMLEIKLKYAVKDMNQTRSLLIYIYIYDLFWVFTAYQKKLVKTPRISLGNWFWFCTVK